MKNIAVLYTGGTLGMIAGEHGLVPDENFVHRAAPYFPQEINVHWHCIDLPIDSSALTPQHWVWWLAWTQRQIAEYDGILILHGTDTLAYTAALFATVFAATNKAIIFTGAQKTLEETDSDAADNLRMAAALFSTDFCGVGIVFAGCLFDPHDCRKFSTEAVQGFTAVYHPPLGIYQMAHEMQGNQLWQFSRLPEKIMPPLGFMCINPALNILGYTLLPGFTLTALTRILDESWCDAVILHSYGHGNIPDSPTFIDAVRRFCAQGKPILNISQVWQGNATARYTQNYALSAAGAVNGGKMTPESALARLTVGLSAGLTGGLLSQYLLS